jgi:hypothetical protein
MVVYGLLVYQKREYSSESLANILLAMLLMCSFQRSFCSDVIPSLFNFLDQGIEWLNNLTM